MITYKIARLDYLGGWASSILVDQSLDDVVIVAVVAIVGVAGISLGRESCQGIRPSSNGSDLTLR